MLSNWDKMLVAIFPSQLEMGESEDDEGGGGGRGRGCAPTVVLCGRSAPIWNRFDPRLCPPNDSELVCKSSLDPPPAPPPAAAPAPAPAPPAVVPAPAPAPAPPPLGWAWLPGLSQLASSDLAATAWSGMGPAVLFGFASVCSVTAPSELERTRGLSFRTPAS